MKPTELSSDLKIESLNENVGDGWFHGGDIMRLVAAIFASAILAACLLGRCSQANAATDDKAAIENVLRQQQDAWNRHDLEAFMQGYWKSDELTFFSGAQENHGWQQALDHYRAAYTSPGHEMGKLEFANLRIEMLGPESAFVRGQYHLTRTDGKTPHGVFTLIFHKFPGGWKIVHDHSSAAE